VEVSGAESAGLRGSSQHVRGDELVLLTRFFRILLGVLALLCSARPVLGDGLLEVVVLLAGMR